MGVGGDRAPGVRTMWLFCELQDPRLRLELPRDAGCSGCAGLACRSLTAPLWVGVELRPSLERPQFPSASDQRAQEVIARGRRHAQGAWEAEGHSAGGGRLCVHIHQHVCVFGGVVGACTYGGHTGREQVCVHAIWTQLKTPVCQKQLTSSLSLNQLKSYSKPPFCGRGEVCISAITGTLFPLQSDAKVLDHTVWPPPLAGQVTDTSWLAERPVKLP